MAALRHRGSFPLNEFVVYGGTKSGAREYQVMDDRKGKWVLCCASALTRQTSCGLDIVLLKLVLGGIDQTDKFIKSSIASLSWKTDDVGRWSD